MARPTRRNPPARITPPGPRQPNASGRQTPPRTPTSTGTRPKYPLGGPRTQPKPPTR